MQIKLNKMKAYNNNGNFDGRMTANLPSFNTLYSSHGVHHNKHQLAYQFNLVERLRKVEIPVRFLIFQIAIVCITVLAIIL